MFEGVDIRRYTAVVIWCRSFQPTVALKLSVEFCSRFVRGLGYASCWNSLVPVCFGNGMVSRSRFGNNGRFDNSNNLTAFGIPPAH